MPTLVEDEAFQKTTSPFAILNKPVVYTRATAIAASFAISGDARNHSNTFAVGATGFTRPMYPNVASSFEQLWLAAMSSMMPRSYDVVLRRVDAYDLASLWKRSWVKQGTNRPHLL